MRGIYECIAFELLSPENAARQLDRLEESIIRLEEFPQKFRMHDKEPLVQQRTENHAGR